MSSDTTGYQSFRARLDAILRQKDPQALRAFLVAEGQWQEDATVDAEAAMWMMIAASKELRDLLEEARAWLMTHGHEVEAQAILGGRGKSAVAGRATASTRGPSGTTTRRQGKSSHPPSSPGRRSPRHGSADGRRPPRRS